MTLKEERRRRRRKGKRGNYISCGRSWPLEPASSNRCCPLIRPTSLNARLTGSRAALSTRLLESSSLPLLDSSFFLLKLSTYILPEFILPFSTVLFIVLPSSLSSSSYIPDYRAKPVPLPSDFFPNPVHNPPLVSLVIPPHPRASQAAFSPPAVVCLHG